MRFVLLATFIASLPGLASAQSPCAQLVLVRELGVESCGDEAELRDRIAARLGADPFDECDAVERPVIVRTTLTHGATGFVADVSFERDAVLGSRHLGPTRHCDELGEQIALYVAVAMDPAGPLAGIDAEVTPAASDSTPQDAAVVTEPDAVAVPTDGTPSASVSAADEAGPAPQTREPPSGTPVELRLGLMGGVSFGWQPDLSAIAAAAVGVRIDQVSLSAELRGLNIGGVGAASTTWIGGAVEGCAELDPVSICGVLVMGRIAARRSDLADAREIESFMAGLGPRAHLAFRPVSWLELSAALEITVTLAGARILVDGQPVWSSPPVAGALMLAATVLVK